MNGCHYLWLILNGKAYDPETAPIYFWVDDPSDHIAKNTEVSTYAKCFQEDATVYEKDMIVKCIDYFISMAGIFGHYDFFTKELWRKEKGYEEKDRAEVMAAFMHWWIRYVYGFNTMPVGCTWSNAHPSSYKEDDNAYEMYINEWMPLFMAYSEWKGIRS